MKRFITAIAIITMATASKSQVLLQPSENYTYAEIKRDVMSVDPQGNVVLVNTITSPMQSNGQEICTFESPNTNKIVKVNNSGVKLWELPLRGINIKLITDEESNIYICSYFRDSIYIGDSTLINIEGYYGMAVISLSPEGSIRWFQIDNNEISGNVKQVFSLADGYLYTGLYKKSGTSYGLSFSKFSTSGKKIWQHMVWDDQQYNGTILYDLPGYQNGILADMFDVGKKILLSDGRYFTITSACTYPIESFIDNGPISKDSYIENPGAIVIGVPNAYINKGYYHYKHELYSMDIYQDNIVVGGMRNLALEVCHLCEYNPFPFVLTMDTACNNVTMKTISRGNAVTSVMFKTRDTIVCSVPTYGNNSTYETNIIHLTRDLNKTAEYKNYVFSTFNGIEPFFVQSRNRNTIALCGTQSQGTNLSKSTIYEANTRGILIDSIVTTNSSNCYPNAMYYDKHTDSLFISAYMKGSITINGTNYTSTQTGMIWWKQGPMKLPSFDTQSIFLQQGWNLISLNIIPQYPLVDSIIRSIKPNVLEIKDDESFYKPQNANYLNRLKTLSYEKAYLVKSSVACSLSVKGLKVPTPVSLGLNQGWNMVGYPGQTKQLIEDIIAPVESNILNIKNFNGFFIPNNAASSLFEFTPGEGYFIKALNNIKIDY